MRPRSRREEKFLRYVSRGPHGLAQGVQRSAEHERGSSDKLGRTSSACQKLMGAVSESNDKPRGQQRQRRVATRAKCMECPDIPNYGTSARLVVATHQGPAASAIKRSSQRLQMEVKGICARARSLALRARVLVEVFPKVLEKKRVTCREMTLCRGGTDVGQERGTTRGTTHHSQSEFSGGMSADGPQEVPTREELKSAVILGTGLVISADTSTIPRQPLNPKNFVSTSPMEG